MQTNVNNTAQKLGKIQITGPLYANCCAKLRVISNDFKFTGFNFLANIESFSTVFNNRN